MIIIPVSKYKDEMLKALTELVAIPSVKGEAKSGMPYGEECFYAL